MPLVLLAALGACGDSSAAGTVHVSLGGEEASLEGYPVGSGESQIAFADGYTVAFDKILVSVTDFTMGSRDGGDADLDTDPVVADLHLGMPDAWTFEGVPARRWDEVGFVLDAPSDDSRTLDGVSNADLERMVDGGYALWVAGTASDGTLEYPFELGFAMRVEASGCHNGMDDTDGLVVPEGGIVDAQVTLHLDHLFFDTYATDDANLRFEPWAATAPANGPILLDDLAGQSLSDITDREGDPVVEGGEPVVYDPGPLMLDSNDLSEYVRAAATTIGHFNGEGHCDYTAVID